MSFLRRFLGTVGDWRQGPSPEVELFDIEYCPAIHSGACPCCGGTTTTLNRLVKRGGLPFAMCRITFAERHLDEPARAILGVGEFGNGTHPDQRVAFGLSLKPDGVMLIDATRPEWADCGLLGPPLLREQALNHPLKAEMFRLIDQLCEKDEALGEFFIAAARRGEPDASPNGGPAESLGDSGGGDGPPSVS